MTAVELAKLVRWREMVERITLLCRDSETEDACEALEREGWMPTRMGILMACGERYITAERTREG